MKKLLSILVLLNFVATLALPDFLQAAAYRIKVYTLAVIPIQPRGDLTANDAEILTQELKRRMGDVNFIQPLALQTINFEESEYCSSRRCALQIGQDLEADLVVYGIVHQMGDFYACEFRIANVQTRKLVGSASYKFDGDLVIMREQMQNIGRKLLGLKVSGDMPISTRSFRQAEQENLERQRIEKAKQKAVEKLNTEIPDGEWQTVQEGNFDSTEWPKENLNETKQKPTMDLLDQDSVETISFNSFGDEAATENFDDTNNESNTESGFDESGDLLGDAMFTTEDLAETQTDALTTEDDLQNGAATPRKDDFSPAEKSQQNIAQADSISDANQRENARRQGYTPQPKKKDLIEITWDEEKDLQGGETTYQLDSFKISGESKEPSIREKQRSGGENSLSDDIWSNYADASAKRKLPVKKSKEELIAERDAQARGQVSNETNATTSTSASANKIDELFPEYKESGQDSQAARQGTTEQQAISDDGFPAAEFLTGEKESEKPAGEKANRQFRVGKWGVYSILATGVGTGVFFAVKNLGKSGGDENNGPPLPPPPAFLGND